jgi:hypothetical protein
MVSAVIWGLKLYRVYSYIRFTVIWVYSCMGLQLYMVYIYIGSIVIFVYMRYPFTIN